MTLAERCRRVKLLVLDVDGVLTDGGIVFSDRGEEIKRFFVRDGSAIKRWERAGKKLALLSGRSSAATLARARDLGIATVVQGNPDKRPGLERLMAEFQVEAAAVAAIGDDSADVPVLTTCGLAIAVADACSEVRRVAHYVTQALGGQGAVREAIDRMLWAMPEGWAHISADAV